MTKAAYSRKDSIWGNSTKRKAEETNEPTRNLPQLFDQKGLNGLIKDLNLSEHIINTSQRIGVYSLIRINLV